MSSSDQLGMRNLMTTPQAYAVDPAKFELAKTLASVIERKFDSKLEIDVIFSLMEVPPNPNMGDFSLPCFRLARNLGSDPKKIAEQLVEALADQADGWLAGCRAMGAFLNLDINRAQLAELVVTEIGDGRYFDKLKTAKPKVMIEFCQPNTHKEFHIGHVRNAALGESLCRLYRYNGYDTTATTFIGDEGTHVAKCLWRIAELGEDLPGSQEGSWYGARYTEANQKLQELSDGDKKAAEQEIAAILAELESKKGKFYDLWLTSREGCMRDFRRIFAELDVNFDHYFYESEVSEPSQRIVDDFIAKGLFKESDGAYGIDLSEWKLGFMMVRKTDGSGLYITKDLALAEVKFNRYNIVKSIYVVGQEQKLHFRQLFKALDLMGFENASNCYHLSYGHVRLPEGKMSSRAGNVVTYNELVAMIEKELQPYLERNQAEWSAEELQTVKHQLVDGTIKYGMLEADLNKDIIFEPSQWTSFEGNTGPYLMYTAARMNSILTKAKSSGISPKLHSSLITGDYEIALLKKMYFFNQACEQACENYRPSILAVHTYELCQKFNKFYTQCSVMNEPNTDIQSSRLALVGAAHQLLVNSLKLMGINAPTRM